MEKTYKITLPKGVSVNEIETNVEDGVLSVSVEMVKERYMPKDGDFVTCGDGYRLWVIIYKHTEHDPHECCYYYVMKNMGLDNIKLDDYCNAQDTMRPSTEEERQELLDALAKEGKRWNAETKQIEDLPRWRAAHYENYYVIGLWKKTGQTIGGHSRETDRDNGEAVLWQAATRRESGRAGFRAPRGQA